MDRGRTVAAPWRTLVNRVEPAHVPGCFKMFNTTGVNRDEPGRTVKYRGDAGAIPAHSGNVRGSTGSVP